MKRPNVYFDAEGDVLYIVTRGGEEENFVEIAKGINVELDKDHEVIGVEILNASTILSPFVNKLVKQPVTRAKEKTKKKQVY